ncbi:MAG: hypothetical protein NUW37_09795 [Planctomycetes bacterium]|nr:hypothetical protein [Planctomycetota bacterium]
MASRREEVFAKIAVQKGYVLEYQADDCIADIETAQRKGKTAVSLQEMLLDRGLMIREHVDHVHELMEKFNIYCPGCKKKYNIFGVKPESRFNCKSCGATLVVPEISLNKEVRKTTSKKIERQKNDSSVFVAVSDETDGEKKASIVEDAGGQETVLRFFPNENP